MLLLSLIAITAPLTATLVSAFSVSIGPGSDFSVSVGPGSDFTVNLGGATQCVSAATALAAEAAQVPVPTGSLASYFANHSGNITNACQWSTQIAGSLSSAFSSYNSAGRSWYQSFASDFNAAKASCRATFDFTVPALPICTNGLAALQTGGSHNAASGNGRDAVAVAGLMAVGGAIGALAVLL